MLTIASTNSPATPTPDSAVFFQLNVYLAQSVRKRQSNVYLGNSGQATSSCTDAVVFSIYQGQLFANSSTQSLRFGTNPGVAAANFTPSADPGSITTQFSVDTQYTLRWINDAFYNSQARFCVLSSGDIIAVFGDPSVSAPANCLFVVLTLSSLDRCPGLQGR